MNRLNGSQQIRSWAKEAIGNRLQPTSPVIEGNFLANKTSYQNLTFIDNEQIASLEKYTKRQIVVRFIGVFTAIVSMILLFWKW